MLLLSGCVAGGSGTAYDFDGDGVQDQDDCDPADPSVYPGATDPYGNDIDEDCDGADGDASDLDNDGEPNETDCGPEDATIYPGANDLYGDDIDQNCDGSDGVDSDGDGYPAPGNGVPADLEDCNDNDAGINPGAEENPNSSPDEDCDGFGRPLQLQIIPEDPRTADTLVLQITTDAVVYDIEWSVDGVPRPEYAGFTTISAGQTSKDQLWSVQVLPYDAQGQPGTPVSASRTILNTAPEASLLVALDPGPTEGDLLTTVVMVADADGDDIELSNAWMVNAVQVNAEPWLGEIDSSYFDKGDEIWVVITPNDGTEDGAAVESNHVFAINTGPSADSVAVDPASGDETTVFTCQVTGWTDPDPADAEAYDYNWTVDGQVVASSATINGTSFDRGQALICQATPNDGEATGTTLTSLPVIVGNSAPTATSAALSPAAPTETDTVTVTVTGWSDADAGDVEDYQYRWHVDGQLAASYVGPTIDGMAFDKGQEIYIEVYPFDGIDLGMAVVSNTVTAVNTPPQISTVTLDPDPATTLSTLTPQVTGWFDPDPVDSPGYTYQWWVNTTTDVGQGTTLASSSFVKNDEVLVEVAPTDGEDVGTAVSSAALVIGNQGPSAPIIAILPAQPTPDDSLVCSITTPSWDPDVADGVDPALTYNFSWTQGSTAQSVWDESGLPESGTATVDSSATLAGETWTCEVAAWDSEEEGAPSSESILLTGCNNSPTAPGTCNDGNQSSCDGCEDGEARNTLSLDGSEFNFSWSPSSYSTSTATLETWFKTTQVNEGSTNNLLATGLLTLRIGTYNSGTSPSGQSGGAGAADTLQCEGGTSSNGNTIYVRSDSKVNDGDWHHLACVFDNGEVRVYFDGVLENSYTPGGTLVPPTGTVTGGFNTSTGQRDVTGRVDEVRFSSVVRYTTSFTPAQRHEMDCDTGFLWHMDDTPGSTVLDATNNGYDLTGMSSAHFATDNCYDDYFANIDGDGDGSPITLDCNDAEGSIYPGAPEILDDGIDQDCDGVDLVCSSIYLNGTSDWVDVPDLSNGSAWTFEAWMDFDWAVGGYLYHTNCHQLSFNPSGSFNATTYPGCNGTNTKKVMELYPVNFSSLPSGWQHIAVSTDGSSGASFFSNGTLIGSSDSWSDNVSGSYNGGLGGRTAGGTPEGFVEVAFAEVRISDSNRYTTSFTPTTSLPVDAATVAHYNFNEQSGNLVADSTGSYDATLISGTWQSECHVDNADGDSALAWLDCDDSDAQVFPGATEIVADNIDQDCSGEDSQPCASLYQPYATTPSLPWLDADGWTLEAWLRVDSLPTPSGIGVFRSLEVCPNGGGMSLNLRTDGRLRLHGADHGSSNVFSDPLSLGTWHHVAVEISGAGASLYLDGVHLGTSGGASGMNCPLEIGRTDVNDVSGLYIDDVRITTGARYGTNFTPPTTLTSDADTLAHYDLGGGSSTSIPDLSGFTGAATLTTGTAAATCRNADPGTSCLDILDSSASIGDDVYWIDPDGTGGFQAWCDMSTDGGGWTTFFAGTNGAANVFSTFEDNQVVCSDPASSCLRPPSISALSAAAELGIRCGSTMVKAAMNADLLTYFASGIQSNWVSLAPTTTIDGSLSSSADISGFWTGASGAANPGWMVSESGGTNRPTTFATSYIDASYDYCNASADSISDISLSYRGVSSGGTWHEQALGVNVELRDVFAVSASRAYAVGQSGSVLATLDGGTNWSPQSSGTTSFLRGVHFVSSTRGWIVGDDATILRTTNGGGTWTAQTSPPSSGALYGVHFVDSTNGTAVGDNGLILRTTNGGATWADVSPNGLGTSRLRKVAFGSADAGWTVGHGDLVLGTTNSGASWNTQTHPGSPPVWFGLDAIDASTAWACGQNGNVIATTDGGVSWISQGTNASVSLNEVSFADANTGWVVGDSGEVYATVDGGSNWDLQPTPGTGHLFSVSFADNENGWAVGAGGVIIHTTSGGD